MSCLKKIGSVYWFTGMPGAGKTTLAKLFYEKLCNFKSDVVFLDGDALRNIYGDPGYTITERKAVALRNAKLCALLAEQGLDVICATVSMFNECYQWNRNHIKFYNEIYVQVPFDILCQRDQKNLYSQGIQGIQENIIGINLKIDIPQNAHLTLDNSGKKPPEELVNTIFNFFIKEEII